MRLFSSGFIDDNPDGLLTKVKMLDMYSQGNMSCFYDSHTAVSNSFHSVLSAAKANMFVDQIFSKYDTDNDGHIDFKVNVHFSRFPINQSPQEFMLATNTSENETAEEKLRWAFKVYDKDSSGKVSCVNLVNEMMTQHFKGTIDCKELMDIVGNMYESQGFSKV